MPEVTSDDRPYYGRARTIGGLVLLVGGVVLTVLDAFSIEYSVDSIVLGLMFGTGVVLLGAEAAGKRIVSGFTGRDLDA